MAEDRPGISPADDPYEFDWPDDAKAQRAAEREEAAAKAAVKPAPLLLSALVIGIGTVLLFIFVVSLAGGAFGFFIATTAPIVLAALILALLPAVLLQRVSVNWPRGLPEVAFIVLGFALGMGWTWAFYTVFQEALFESAGAMAAARVRGSVFMGTAVASAFIAARYGAQAFSTRPRAVYVIAAVIGALTIFSIIANVTFR